MNASGSPTCCNADGTTRCVIKQVNATVRTPGGRIVGKLVRLDQGWRIDHWLLNDAAKCK